jgi:hypothetical protein
MYARLKLELKHCVFIFYCSPFGLDGEEGEELMKDFVRVVFDPGRSIRPGLVLLALGSPKLLGGPTAGSLFLLFLKSLAMPVELKDGVRCDWYWRR